VLHLGGAAQGIAVAVAHAVALVDEIEMGVHVDDVDRVLVVEGSDAGDVHRVVAAEHHRQGARLEDLANAELDIVVALVGIGVNHVSVADVDHAHFVDRQVGDVVLEVVGPVVAEGKEGRGLADRARPEARAGAVLGAHVEGRAEDRDVGVDRVPVETGRLLAEGTMTNEGQIEAPALVSVLCHGTPCLSGVRSGRYGPDLD
jgi:hypothetical protein